MGGFVGADVTGLSVGGGVGYKRRETKYRLVSLLPTFLKKKKHCRT